MPRTLAEIRRRLVRNQRVEQRRQDGPALSPTSNRRTGDRRRIRAIDSEDFARVEDDMILEIKELVESLTSCDSAEAELTSIRQLPLR